MEDQNIRKDEGVRLALEDVALIKRIIDRSQVNLRRLGWLFLVYGGVTLGMQLLTAVFTVFMTRLMSADQFTYAGLGSEAVTMAVKAVLLILFIRKRRELLPQESVYTMKLFDLWGITLFAPYVLTFIVLCVNGVMSVSVPDFAPTVILLSRVALDAMKYGAVCMSVFVTGLFAGKMLMKWGAGVLALLLPILLLTGAPYLLGAVPDVSGTLSAYGYFTSVNALVNLLLTVVYVVLGIVLLKGKRGAYNGAE